MMNGETPRTEPGEPEKKQKCKVRRLERRSGGNEGTSRERYASQVPTLSSREGNQPVV